MFRRFTSFFVLTAASLFAQQSLYISSPMGLQVVDTQTRQVVKTDSSSPTMLGRLALTPDGSRLIVGTMGTLVRVLSTATNAVVSSPDVGASPVAITASGDSRFAYVVVSTGAVRRITLSSGVADTVFTPTAATDPADIVTSRAGNRLYLAERASTGAIRVFTIQSDGSLVQAALVTLTGKPKRLALTVDDLTLLAAGEGISFVNTTTNTVLYRIHPGYSNLDTISVADRQRVYVNNLATSAAGDGLLLLNLATNRIDPVLDSPFTAAGTLSSDGWRLWYFSPSEFGVQDLNLASSSRQTIAGTSHSNYLLAGPPPRNAAGCIADLSQTAVELPVTASTQSIGVMQSPDCAWTASAGATWLTVVSGATGLGNGVVTFSAAVNPGVNSRSATVVIAGTPVTVTQAGRNCPYSITPGSRIVGPNGGSGEIEVSTSAGCAWTAASDASWIRIQSGASGTGRGLVKYAMDPGVSVRRTATITVARQTFTISQLPVGNFLQCIAFPDMKYIRGDGLSELIGDIVLECQHGGPTPVVVNGDIFLQVNAPITNNRGSGDITDALALFGEPMGGTLTGANYTIGTNAMRGVLAGPNRLRFTGQFTLSGLMLIRITNVRVNAAQARVNDPFGVVTARVAIRSATPVAIDFDTAVLAMALPVPRATLGAVTTSTPNIAFLPVSFSERVLETFRPRLAAGQSPNSTTRTRYFSESGFLMASVANAGLADHGTRFRIRVPVPTGVKVYAPLNAGSADLTVKLSTANENGEGAPGDQTGTATFNSAQYRELPVTGGFATAIWEVRDGTASADLRTVTFPLVLEATSEAQRTEMQKGLVATLAPVSTVMTSQTAAPTPRFLDPQNAPAFVNLRVVSRLVRPGVLAEDRKAVRAAVGSNFTFTYDVLNDSSVPATGVQVGGAVPDGFSYSACSVAGCTVSGGDFKANLGTLSAGGFATLSVQATQTKTVESGAYLESRVAATSNEADTDLGSNESASGYLLEDCPSGSISPLSATFPVAGGTGQFDIAGTCTVWTVRSSAEWVLIDTAKSGIGAFTTRFTVVPNLGTASRTATILAGGQAFTVTQAGLTPPCAVTITSAGQTAPPAEGRNGTLGVTAAGCGWTASSNQTWLEIYPLSGTGNGTIFFTAYPNFGTLARSATVTVGTETVTITQAGMTGSQDLRFVRRAYFNALRRLPSAAEEQFHAARLTAGATRADVMRTFLDGGEFRFGGAFVSGLYRVLLGRVPERGGWAFQLNSVVQLGTPQSTLAGVFLNSAEWLLKQGGTITDAQFITLIYQEVLGRAPSPAELTWQIGNLAASTRAQMATNFISSPEFFLYRGALLNALHLHFVILGRDPTPAELTATENQLRGGTSFASAIATFLANPEHDATLQ